MQDKYFVDTNIFLYSILEPKDKSNQLQVINPFL